MQYVFAKHLTEQPFIQYIAWSSTWKAAPKSFLIAILMNSINIWHKVWLSECVQSQFEYYVTRHIKLC